MNYEQKYLKYKKKYLNLKKIGAGRESYMAKWHSLSDIRMTFPIIIRYYDLINFDFLQDKVTRELDHGNAGGPAIRRKFPAGLTNEHLAECSIRGLRKLLAIKTVENAYNFFEKTLLTDHSLLTDLAWHSLMLKPHKYFLITNNILKIIDGIHSHDIPTLAEKTNQDLLSDRRCLGIGLVRHGTQKDLTLEFDIRDAIREFYPEYKTIDTDPEWNMPVPLFDPPPHEEAVIRTSEEDKSKFPRVP
jgi:hypothetical protein